MLFGKRSIEKRKVKTASKKEWVEFILSSHEHEWISQDRFIRENFIEFLCTLPLKDLKKISTTHKTLFIPVSGVLSCAINTKGNHVVLIYPDLINLLKSCSKSWFKAVLAHEVGHILNEHSSRSISTLEAQVEADDYAIQLGLSEELENFLLDSPESIEKRVRLTYLTSKFFN